MDSSEVFNEESLLALRVLHSLRSVSKDTKYYSCWLNGANIFIYQSSFIVFCHLGLILQLFVINSSSE